MGNLCSYLEEETREKAYMSSLWRVVRMTFMTLLRLSFMVSSPVSCCPGLPFTLLWRNLGAESLKFNTPAGIIVRALQGWLRWRLSLSWSKFRWLVWTLYEPYEPLVRFIQCPSCSVYFSVG